MLITVAVSDAIVREAQSRNLQVTDFVETLIDKGMETISAQPALNTAIKRIRALRFPEATSGR